MDFSHLISDGMAPSSNLQQTASAAASTPTAAVPYQTLKLAVAVALLKSKLSTTRIPPVPSSQSQTDSQIHRWKRKAKDRKQEILRLNEYLKELENDSHGDLYPQTAACKCYFFSDSAELGHNQLPESTGYGQRLNDALRRRFLRQVRLRERTKRRASGSAVASLLSDSNSEDSTDQLKVSADFLVNLCCTSSMSFVHLQSEGASFANWAHQAVDFILGSLKSLLSAGKDETIEAIVNSLVTRLVRELCKSLDDGIVNTENDRRIDVQHIICKLGSMAYVGQRVLVMVSQKIPELSEILLHLDPFDASFPYVHDSMFLMIQLMEMMISEYFQAWSGEESFDVGLFEEWVTLFSHGCKAVEVEEDRMRLYALYLDRVTSLLAREVGQAQPLLKLNPDILHNLFS